MSTSKYICIHGHFYQPPRENPWLEVVEVQDSAAPFHDWNQRITKECYAPNAAARILGDQGRITRIYNNYQRLSFNFGPTLLGWMDAQAPATAAALASADAASAQMFGHGSAMAQVFNHILMPLANTRDKLTQIRWGIFDFQRRFGRDPEGMWLAETAVDDECLRLLAQEGIKFTVLAPRQAEAVRPDAKSEWHQFNGEEVDPKRPYRVDLGDGLSITVFFYDGPLSKSVAFEKLLDDGGRFAARIKGALDPGRKEPQILSLATDGESYGHHHRFGEMALAWALKTLEEDPEVQLTNFASFLAEHPPTWEAKVRQNTSWSCVHGVERWRSDCGCKADPGRGWNQAWRAPLRQGLDQLRDHLAGQFEEMGYQWLEDPWAARDAYIALWHDTSPQAKDEFLAVQARRQLNPEERCQVFKLLEAQRYGLYMFTSCGWFFDDISGLEPLQNLRYAARALQLAGELGAKGWEDELLETLAEAKSNLVKEGTGADIWRAKVAPAQVGAQRVAAHAAISGVLENEPPEDQLYCYQLSSEGHRHRGGLGVDLSWGRLKVTHQRLEEETPLVYAALHPGGHEFHAWVAPDDPPRDLRGLEQAVEEPLRLLEMGALRRLLLDRVGGSHYELGDLFLEGRRQLAMEMLVREEEKAQEHLRQVYQSGREIMVFLHKINVPPPTIYATLASAMLTEELVRGLREPAPGELPDNLPQIVLEAKELGLSLDCDRVRLALGQALEDAMGELAAEPGATPWVERATGVLDLALALDSHPDLWAAQNHFYILHRDRDGQGLPPELRALGKRLGFALNGEPSFQED